MIGAPEAVSGAAGFLALLEHVREIRPGQWRAKCPAHDGKSAGSLSIAETPDGTVLVRCWGGCDLESIAAAVGLQVKDFFPARELAPADRRDYSRKTAEREARLVLRHELFVLQQTNDARLEGWPIIDSDPEGRERLAARRVLNALRAIYAAP